MTTTGTTDNLKSHMRHCGLPSTRQFLLIRRVTSSGVVRYSGIMAYDRDLVLSRTDVLLNFLRNLACGYISMLFLIFSSHGWVADLLIHSVKIPCGY